MDQRESNSGIEDQEELMTSYNSSIPSTSRNYRQKKNKKIKWKFLEHNGPVFPSPYKPLPKHVKFKYNGQVVKLSQDAEEVAGFYAIKLHLDCVNKPTFNNNFFAGWREVMTPEEKLLIQDFTKCDFKGIQEYFIQTKEERNRIKKEKEKKDKQKYGYCMLDTGKGRIKEPINNYKIEPPDLFCAIGESPLMGTIKKRVAPNEVTINCSNDSKEPKPPEGYQWRGVKNDNTVSWLASWVSNVKNEIKYILLDERSNQKQNNERAKYEIARQLHEHIDRIREYYRADWQAVEYEDRQRGVALYFIDTLGFRAGNEEKEREADTAGCCSLKIKHVKLYENNKVAFDFAGKASIKYKKDVIVEKLVYRNLISFIENKNMDDDLFDQLDTAKLNQYLNDQMPNLTAKVFRTYLASTTFERNLNELTYSSTTYEINYLKKIMMQVFKEANMNIAKLLNHKVTKKRKNSAGHTENDKSTRQVYNTTTSLSKYIDPRIVITWCERFGIPIKDVYTKKLREKFTWAIEEAGPNFLFCW